MYVITAGNEVGLGVLLLVLAVMMKEEVVKVVVVAVTVVEVMLAHVPQLTKQSRLTGLAAKPR